MVLKNMQFVVTIALTVLSVGISLALGGVRPGNGFIWWFFVPCIVMVCAGFGCARLSDKPREGSGSQEHRFRHVATGQTARVAPPHGNGRVLDVPADAVFLEATVPHGRPDGSAPSSARFPGY